MIFDIRQTYSGFSASYEIVSGLDTLGRAEIDRNFLHRGEFHFSFQNTSFSMAYHPLKKEFGFGKSVAEKRAAVYQISQNGVLCGDIGLADSTDSLLTRYQYYMLIYEGETYSMYRVGLGNEGIKFPIYCGDRQVAQIEKDNVVHDNLDVFHVYAMGDRASKVALMMGLYLDAYGYANRGEIVKKSVAVHYERTFNKKLIEKYDPTFTTRVERF